MCEHFIGGLCNIGFTAESVFVFITIGFHAPDTRKLKRRGFQIVILREMY